MKMNGVDLSQKNAGKLWTDLQAYFMELFEEYPEKELAAFTAKELASDMKARFKNKYDAEAITGLLKNGFQAAGGLYYFKRTDFVKEPVKMEEVQS